MLDGFSVAAPAKINLGLSVLPKRSDGFHDIKSIFQTVGLYDNLIITPLSDKNVCRISCKGMALPESNTLSKTYNAALSVLGQNLPGLDITLEKNIPSGGGLGGGSSDAAALLRAIKMCGVDVPQESAFEIASKVGSDVFFFLDCEGKADYAALVQGRGEVVKPIPARRDLHWILVFPGVHSSTPEAYAWVDEKRAKEKTCINFEACDLEYVYRRPIKDWNFTNDFTSVVAERYQMVRQALDDVKDTGALFFDMSGSGSTVFGVYENAQHCQDANRQLAGKWKTVSL